MKHILLIAIALITVNVTAQDHKRSQRQWDRMDRAHQLEDFSPEEIATLQTKTMALRLDLTKAQQNEMQAIHLEQAKARKTEMEARKKMHEAGKSEKPSKEDRFKRMSNQLDNKLAAKAKIKKILNDEQYQKWERNNTKKGKQKRVKSQKQRRQKRAQKQRQRN